MIRFSFHAGQSEQFCAYLSLFLIAICCGCGSETASTSEPDAMTPDVAISAECGNGQVEGDEECDDGNSVETDACLNNCLRARCGDGIVHADNELCDDGNQNDGDECRNNCSPASCGDGVVQVGVEECDDGNQSDTDSCLPTCVAARCGDGIVHIGTEDCDDANDVNEDECKNDCRAARCGDGVVQDGVEACDDGNNLMTDGCLNNCVLAQCGDGIVHVGVEDCDDGNTDETDGCLTGCQAARCGDGIVHEGTEECDDGNNENADDCLNNCRFAQCGDGVIQIGIEDCDDGNDDDSDACPSTCTQAYCGDGFVREGREECDDGNGIETDDCPSTCQVARCGDGLLWAGVEDCDDANDIDTDACRSNCQAARCGDGIIHAGFEVCDDANDFNGDACTNECESATCGDGYVFVDVEECDDGNAVETDLCRTDCSLGVCGDGVVIQGVEECDDGNVDDSDDCLNSCEAARCGDGIIRVGVEECDDQNRRDDDGCRNTCERARCGDGIIRVDVAPDDPRFEECDDGNGVDTDACLNTCRSAACGDGVIRAGREECDDGNLSNTDSCSNRCRSAYCGDGILRTDLEPTDELYEACDDGNLENDDACLVNCQVSRCGDGFVNLETEECDDENLDDNDPCLSTCVVNVCGDGFVRPDQESCDDGNDIETDACLSTCVVASCGDGFIQDGVEACDDNNRNDDDGCLNTCTLARCGDGVRRTDVDSDNPDFEACDDGNDIEQDGCKTDCQVATCGDGVVRADLPFESPDFEECDDGNDNDNDGCKRDCSSNVCGDGFVYLGIEDCDDGNEIDTDSCLTGCINAQCGDNIVQFGAEDCDDGNLDDGDDCLSGCRFPHCGDGYLRRGVEDCDDGDVDNTDECVEGCRTAACGDGFVYDGVEECDDGNNINTDSCLSDCTNAVCGDGIIHAGVEDCDDGNLTDGDGCESNCTTCAAMGFDGTGQHVSIRRPDNIFYFESVTVEAWIRWDGRALPHPWSVVAGHGAAQRVFRLQIKTETGQVFFDVHQDGQGPRAVIQPNEWTHVAGVNNGQTLTLYVNGVPVDTKAGGGLGHAFAVRNFGLGAVPGSTDTTAFSGDLRHVRISHNVQYNDPFIPQWRLDTNADTIGFWPLRIVENGLALNSVDALHHGDVIGASVNVIDCQTGLCGNGQVELAEQCDDGNIDGADGCSEQCQTVCASRDFNGSDSLWIEQSLNSVLAPENRSFTLEGWVRQRTANQNVGRTSLGVSCGPRVDLADDDRVRLHVGQQSCSGESVVMPGQWHHIAISMTAQAPLTVSLMVDGRSQCRIVAPNLDATAHLDGQVLIGTAADQCLLVDGDQLGDQGWIGQVGPVRLSNGLIYDGDFTPDGWLERTETTVFLSNHLYPKSDDRIRDEGPLSLAAVISDLTRQYEGPGCGQCGDGIRQLDEECDDGNRDQNDGCTNSCNVAVCGDGLVFAGTEQCDDGNRNGGDGCEPGCTRTASFWDFPFVHDEPSRRANHAMAYDPATRDVVVFGGTTGADCGTNPTLGDLWRWNGFDWIRIQLADGPSPREGAQMAADPTRGGLLLYGGWDRCGNGGLTYFTDTWHWDGASWTRINTQEHPGQRTHFAMIDDVETGSIYVYGGAAEGRSQMYRWTGVNWTEMAEFQQPGDVQSPQLERHPLTGDILLMDELAQLWQLTDARWEMINSPDGPQGRLGGSLVSDVRRGELMLLGGIQGDVYVDDSWYWNGLQWARDNIQAGVGQRHLHRMAYDVSQGHIIVFGGYTDQGVAAGTMLRR
ncbi:MAG: DUF4215 domain-containing protein [Myxococcota bacterium]|nr:DUF4215 domain-containing protein [Myxococcota bacterium]